ncbi:MAG: ATP-dependent Clp protease proteolytic subunit [Candidatus Pacearchaeota archaeon]
MEEAKITLDSLEIFKKNLEKREEEKKKGIFFINSIFDDILLEFIFFDLKKAIENKNIEKITLYINSNGGNTTVMFPFYDLIKSTSKTIKTIVIGKAYSAGAMILLAGTKGSRFAMKNSEILLHEVATEMNWSKNSQIMENAKNINLINKKLKEIVKENSKMTDKEIDLYFASNKDIFITSQQALKYGIIDKIL